jgi:hypothetical protein
MKPDWDKLGTQFAESDAVTIVDVDCTATGGDKVCQQHGVRGYPSIKYKLANDKGLKDYNGAREFAGLKEFVDKTFKKPCDWKTGTGCAPNEKEFIAKWSDKSAAEVKEELDKRNADLKAVRKEKSDAETELKTKIKEFTKKEKNMQKSLNLLKDMEKAKKKEEL